MADQESAREAYERYLRGEATLEHAFRVAERVLDEYHRSRGSSADAERSAPYTRGEAAAS